MEFSFPSSLSDDFNLLKKSVKKSFTQKIKKKATATLVLFCFYYEKYRPKHSDKVSPALKTAENSHSGKSPYNALQAQYWTNVHHVCQ